MHLQLLHVGGEGAGHGGPRLSGHHSLVFAVLVAEFGRYKGCHRGTLGADVDSLTTDQQGLHGLVTQLSDLGEHALRVLRVLALSVLFALELARLRACFEPSEEEGERCEAEEGFLCFAAVLVHWISDDSKFNKAIHQVLIILCMAMRKHQQLQELDKLALGLLSCESAQQTWELLVGIRDERGDD